MLSNIQRLVRLLRLSLSTIDMGDNYNIIPQKKFTLSGVYRIKNAESSIELAIRSIIDVMDEVIVVDNESSDGTLDILIKLQKKYPNKIKIFHYNKKLCRAGKNYADCVRRNPSGSLAKYYNYAFSKATSEYVMKCDANYIFTLKGKIDIINALNKNPDVLCYPGVEIFGHHHSIEPFVYLRKLNYKYCDGMLWEFLHYERTAKIKKILNPCFVHIKRINYNKYIHSEHKGVDGLYGSYD